MSKSITSKPPEIAPPTTPIPLNDAKVVYHIRNSSAVGKRDMNGFHECFSSPCSLTSCGSILQAGALLPSPAMGITELPEPTMAVATSMTAGPAEKCGS